MNTQTITNEMLYTALQELTKEFRLVKDDFEVLKVDVRSLKEDMRLVKDEIKSLKEDFRSFKIEVNQHFERIDNQQTEDRKILMELWENSSKQNLNFTSTYFLVTFMTSVLGSWLISYLH